MHLKNGLAIVLMSICSTSFAENYYWGFNPETKKFGFSNQSGEKVTFKEAFLGANGITPKKNIVTATKTENSSSIVLNTLNATELLPALFGQRQVNRGSNSSELKFPFIAMQQSIDGEKQLRYIQQHPTLTYQNVQNQLRYFVFLESIPTIGTDVNSCHGCYVKGYLLNFKKNPNGTFELTNPKTKLVDIPSSYGESHLKISDIQKGLQRVGQNAVGSIFETGFTSGGATTSLFELLVLQDQDVTIKRVGDAGVFGTRYIEAKDREYEYGYEGKYKILTTEPNAELYPIQISYSGTDWSLKKKNNSIIQKYNAATGSYPEYE
jgi:hypothetical protein